MLDPDALRTWALDNLTLVRSLLVLCAAGWLVVLVRWLRPDAHARRAATLAVVVQLGVGTLLDVVCVRLGAWSYREMPLLVAGVPADLHVAWALLWGFGLVWLADRWLGRRPRGRVVLGFLAGASAVTVAFDAAISRWLLFVDDVAPWWWLADAAFLFATLGLTLWMHRSTGAGSARTCGLGRLPPLPARVRSWLLVATFAAFFFVVLPGWVVDAAEHFGVAARAAPLPWLPTLLAVPGCLLLLWGVHEFARAGRGTPVPWDPPRFLVTSGPYAFTANPMQTGGILLALAGAAACPTWVGLVYALDVIAVVVAVFRPSERRQLAERYGERAAEWASAVPAFVWRRRPYEALGTSQAVVFFDDGCGFCRRFVDGVLRLDGSGTLDLAPLLGDRARRLLPPDTDAARGEALALWEPGTCGAPPLVTTGGEAVLRLAARLPFPLCAVGALAAVPGVLPVVELGYRLVARRARPATCRLEQPAATAPPKQTAA